MKLVIEGDILKYFLLPFLIFFSRIFDVTIGTMRIIFLAKGKKKIVPLLGFLEVLLWLIVITKVMQNLENIFCYIAYAGGFAAGNYVGMFIEEKLALGLNLVQIVAVKDTYKLRAALEEKGFGYTIVYAKGKEGDVTIIYTVVKRVSLDNVLKIIHYFNPKAFYCVQDIKSVNEGIFPEVEDKLGETVVKRWRKGK